MARKKMRRFAEGGASDEIVVVGGKRPSAMEELSTFNLSRIGGSGGLGGGLGSGMAGMGGGSSQRLAAMGPAPGSAARNQTTVRPVMMSSKQSDFDRLTGAPKDRGFGLKLSTTYAKGGKADGEPTGGKKRTKAKKYAAGGSTASRRADGCATKGKTKGRFV